MKFRSLQDNLRKTLQQRINAGELTGLRLAEQTGFRQAHISNFLNRKRSLSMDGMDRVLNIQRLSVLELLDPSEVNKRSSLLAPSKDEFDNVALVESDIASTQTLIMSMYVREIQKLQLCRSVPPRRDEYLLRPNEGRMQIALRGGGWQKSRATSS